MTLMKASLKLAGLVVAMLAAIGAWEIYKGTVKPQSVAQAQAQAGDIVELVTDIHRAVVGDDGFGPRLHFKCYGITPGGQSLNVPVTLFDQFFPPDLSTTPPGGGDQLTVRAKHLLCTPALKRIRS